MLSFTADGGFVRRFILFVALALAACASEPYIALTSGAATPDDLQFKIAIQNALDSSPPIDGNKITVLNDGKETLPAMFKALSEARDHINLEYYIFDDVHVGYIGVGDILMEKLAEGVSVNVIYDSYGSRNTPSAFLDRLRSAGAKFTAFNPLDPLKMKKLSNPNDRDHRKIMVIDGRTAFMGGVNLDRVYENPANAGAPEKGETTKDYWRDTDVRIDGPAVADVQRLFMDTWAKQKGEKLEARDWFPKIAPAGNQRVRIIGSAPGEDRPLYYVSILSAIHAARHRIGLGTGFFVPTHQEREELENAARRGVAVRLVLPSQSDSPSALAAGRAAYGDLLEAGVQIAEMQNAILHSKLVVVDGVWTAIGSSNLDRRSVVFNNEVDAIILGRETGDYVQRVLDNDVSRSRRIDLKTWENRTWGERRAEFFSRLWEFML
jgi:cardiolipin synthase A/B